MLQLMIKISIFNKINDVLIVDAFKVWGHHTGYR